jgi:hypothetical protein
MTRRTLFRLITGTALLAGLRGRARGAPTALSWSETIRAGISEERRYRADAQVVILSIPLLHRAGVGGGRVGWRETDSNGASLRLLEFLGYSDPKRAAGLNRLGFIRELVRVSDNHVSEALYFGLMTSSPEESAEDARKALHPTASEVTYSAIEGRMAPGNATTAGAHFMASAKLSASQSGELEGLARQALTSAAVKAPEFDPHRAVSPFLETMAELLSAPHRDEGRYVYGGRLYRLWLHRAPDPKATEYFRERHMAAGNIIRVAGKLRREAGGKEWEFRLWAEEGAARPIPLRIEYQPKSYLRLTFEAEG